MDSHESPNSDVSDSTDRKILHALQLDPRASYRRIADVLGISEQTVGRRYRQLESTGLIRVVATIGPSQVRDVWMMRVRCRPSAAMSMARLLAAQDNVAWVSLVEAGSELLCALRVRVGVADDDLLLQRLPRAADVLGLSAHSVLHVFYGGQAEDWSGYGDHLSPAQRAELLGSARAADESDATDTDTDTDSDGDGDGDGDSEPAADAPRRFSADPIDNPLMTMLAADGRASLKQLARHCGVSEQRVGRRLAVLRRSDWLRLEVEVATAMLGFQTSAYLWLVVAPADIHRAGLALAGHRETVFVAAVSGTATLMASTVCRNPADLYHYVTTKVAAVQGVRQVEISLTTQRIKHERSRETGRRLQH
jgi:DNA-binding Lrp family transcriptional regulator